jgi:hypothetical protein
MPGDTAWSCGGILPVGEGTRTRTMAISNLL